MSRAAILNAVRAAQPARLPDSLHENELAVLKALPQAASLVDFVATLDLIGARCIRGRGFPEAATWLRENLPPDAVIASNVPALPGTLDLGGVDDPHDLDGIHTAVLQARFGVCENGAVWLEDTDLGPHRVLPFIAEHLFIVMRAEDLVATMHQAYERIGAFGGGFGVFLAGPSKTADIEQCLVIGAHGARGATVFIIE